MSYQPEQRYAKRITFVGKGKKRTQYTASLVRALRRLGCEVQYLNLHRLRQWLGARIAHPLSIRLVGRFRPDLVLSFGRDLPLEVLRVLRERYRSALLLDDYAEVTETPRLQLIRLVDDFFITHPGQNQEYEKAGVKRVHFTISGVDPELHRPGQRERRFENDVAFIGKAYYASRVRLVKQLIDAGVDLGVYGADWPAHGVAPVRTEVGPADFRNICASSKIVLGIDKATDSELCLSNRTWIAMGCGAFFLTNYVKGLETLFANHEHLVWFRSPEEAVDLARFYLAHDALRQKIARSGRAFVHAHYPFDRMMESLCRVIFRGLEPIPLTDPGPSFGSAESALRASSQP